MLFGALVCAHAQLYLITGVPMSESSWRFPSELVQVAENGSVTTVAELAPKQPGATFITVSHDLGIALVQSDRMVILDLATARVVKSCLWTPGPPHAIWLYQWLLNMPSRGGVVAEEFGHTQDSGSTLRGTLADPKVECSESYITLDPSDLRYVAAQGGPLIGDTGDYDSGGLYARLAASGELQGSRSGLIYSYGYSVPAEQLAGLRQPFSGIGVNNSEILVLCLSSDGGKGPDYRDLALRKSDNTWHRITLPSFPWPPGGRPPAPRIRGFGHFVAMVERRPRDLQNRESAGREEWKRRNSETGPDVAGLFEGAKVVFPGKLHLYDVNTERSYTISTNQGDSEILLVENSTVYYRASDRVYSVAIMDAVLGAPHLIATGDAIRDAHWAFLRH